MSVSPFPFRTGLAGLCVAALLAAPAEAARPKVGLVLGGGGARGSAHLGILEVLEENRIPVDCVAGTSMGALVAGAYVAGIAPAEMKQTIRQTDWAGIFDDSAGREAVRMRQKMIDDRYFSALEFGVKKDGLHYREGAVAGEKIKLFFNQLVREELGERSIEELPLPLTLIATDIGTGERVAMRTGSLTSAMRASMSVPGALAPVVREGRKLVDGGLVDNVPIAEVHERCKPDVVIAVNVGSPMLKPEQVGGLLSVVGQMVNLLTEQNVTKSLQLLRPQDIYIKPELGDLTAADFERQMEGADIGRKAALEVVERLRKLSVSGPEYREWRSRLRLTPHSPPVIDAIEVAETQFVSPDALRQAIRQEVGKPLDPAALSDDLVRIYSYGDLRTLDYSVQTERDRTVLRITPFEKPLGPDYLRFGLNLSTDFATDADYNLRALYRKTWLNSLGAELLTTLQIGSQPAIAVEFYQPLDHRQLWFVRPIAALDRNTVGLYLDGERVSDYRIIQTQATIEAGANLDSYGIARLGWYERRTDASLITGTRLFPDLVQRVGGPRAGFVADTYDKLFFPSRGIRWELDYFDAQHVSAGGAKYGRAESRFGAATSIGDLILLGQLDAGRSTHGELPASDLFSLGGPRRLAAFAQGQIRGDDYTYGRIEGQWRLTRPLPLLGLSLLAGISLESGRMKKPVTEPSLTGWLGSYSVYLSTTTAFGPAYFGYAYGPDGKGRVYLFLGTP